MFAFKYRLLSIGISCILMILALGNATSVLADSTTGTGTIGGGTLSETIGSAPTPSLTLDGLDHIVNYTLAITTNDPTGTGLGWNLTITSTTFSTGGGSPKTLATTASSITGVTAVCVGGITCTNPVNSITYPLTVPAGSTAPTAVKFFNAAALTGLGQFTITPTVAITVPANTYAGTYSSTITVAISNGP